MRGGIGFGLGQGHGGLIGRHERQHAGVGVAVEEYFACKSPRIAAAHVPELLVGQDIATGRLGSFANCFAPRSGCLPAIHRAEVVGLDIEDEFFFTNAGIRQLFIQCRFAWQVEQAAGLTNGRAGAVHRQQAGGRATERYQEFPPALVQAPGIFRSPVRGHRDGLADMRR